MELYKEPNIPYIVGGINSSLVKTMALLFPRSMVRFPTGAPVRTMDLGNNPRDAWVVMAPVTIEPPFLSPTILIWDQIVVFWWIVLLETYFAFNETHRWAPLLFSMTYVFVMKYFYFQSVLEDDLLASSSNQWAVPATTAGQLVVHMRKLLLYSYSTHEIQFHTVSHIKKMVIL